MIYPRTLVCLILYARLWCSALKDKSESFYSFYDDADNYWDFDLPDNIVDNKTSRQSGIQGVVSTTRSPAGTGLLVHGGTVVSLNAYSESGVEDGAIPIGCLDPATCVHGFSVSVLIKVIGSPQALKGNISLFGNRISELHKGWSVRVLDKTLQIFVVTDEFVCSFTGTIVMANIWFHLGFSWKKDKLEVYIDDERFHDHHDNVLCKHVPFHRLLQQEIKLESVESTAAAYDSLAIWYKKRSRKDSTASWDYLIEFSRIPLEAYLDVVLLDLSWHQTLERPDSAKSKALVDEFQNKMDMVNNSVDGNIVQASVSTFRENEAKVAAIMYFHLRLSTLETLMQLQDIFESGTLFNSRIAILNCSATDESFCRVPDIVDVKIEAEVIRFYLHHFAIGNSGIIYSYMIVSREFGEDDWRQEKIRKSIQNPTKLTIKKLKPFTNYSIRIFHYSLLGFRLGTELTMYQTAEAAPEDAPTFTNLYAVNTTTLFASWLHDITPDKLNGILIGYQVRWKGPTSSKVLLGPEESSYYITGLAKDQKYTVYVAGRTNAGVGVENKKDARTGKDEDGGSGGGDGDGNGGSGNSSSIVPPIAHGCETNPCTLGETCIDGEGSFFCLRITNDDRGSSCVSESRARILNIDKNVNIATELRKGEQYLLTTEVNSSCNQLSFEWKIANVRLVPFAVDTAHFTTIGLDSEWNDISSLDLGIYLVEFIVYFEGYYFLDYGFLRLLPSPPVALIAGGSEVSRNHNSVIIFDASLSYDVDLGPGEYEGMSFTWSCSNTSRGSCVGFERHALTDGDRMLFLDATIMQVNQYYDIKLTIIENGMSSSFEQRVHIVTVNPLYVEINCIMNCGLEVNPSVRVTVVMNCTNSPCLNKNVQLRYQWTLFIQSPSNESWTKVDHENMAGTPLNSSSLVIQPNRLIPGRNYYLSASIDNLMDRSSSGFSLWYFTMMSVSSGGVCTVNPPSGVALKQTFIFACANWADGDQLLLYEFITTAQGLTTILSYGYLSTVELTLPPGDPAKNYYLTIEVYIINSTGCRAKTTVDVQVFPWTAMSKEEASDDIGRVLEGSLVPFIIGGDLKRGSQLASALLSSLELQKGDIITIENGTQIKNVTITVLSRRKVRELRKLIQASYVLALAMDDPLEITPKVQELIMGMLQDMTGLLASIADRGNVPDVPYIEIAESNLVFAWGKQLQLSAAEGEQLSISSSGSERDNLRNQTLNSLEMLHMVLRIIAKSKVIDEEPTVIRTNESVDALVVRLHPDKVSGYSLTLKSASVQLPDNLNDVLDGVGDFVDVEVIWSPINFFVWDPSANEIVSGVLEIELRGESGQVISVNNLENDIELGIQLNEQSVKNESIGDVLFFLKPGKMKFHRIDVAQKGTSYLLTIITITTFQAYVKRGSKPSVEDHERKYTIPDFSSCIREIGEDEYNCRRNPHQLLLTNDVLTEPGVYYLGFLFSGNASSGNHSHRARRSCFSTNRQKRSCVETKDPPPPLGQYVTAPLPSYDPLTDVNYTLDTEELSCRFWSEDQQKWVTDGCKVGSGSTRDHLLCLCNHLTSFGGSLLVAPNPIDMDVVFNELSRLHETGNFSVLLTIIFMFTLYVLAILLAKRADRRDNDKLGPTIVLKTEEDNNEPYPNHYEIIVSTGVWLGSGTTANVTMLLYGSSCNSGKITVSPDMNPSQVLLSRGSVDKFIIPLSTSLGTLHHAYIWHDNSGDSPSWFLDYIIVKDKETKKEWKMACNQWFSPDKDDGSIFRKLLVERTNSQLPAFQEAFRSQLTNSLYETHLWMSSVTKRPGNTFTRAQRVTCCLCLVFTAMLANAMFHNLGGDVKSSAIRIGPLKVSIRQLVITIQSCLIIAPVNLVIVAIFKNSSPSFDKHCCKRSKLDEKSHGLDEDLDKEDKKPLHHIFVYISWFLSLAVSIASATVVFFYSLMWGKETADEWLSSILMSITMDILAIQPVRLIILAAVAAVIKTKAKKAKASQVKVTDKQSSTELDEDNDKDIIANEDLPDPRQLEWFKKYRMDQAETMALFRSLTFFLSFLVILAIVCYGNRDYHQYLMGQEVRAILPKAEKVNGTQGLWTWMNNTFANSIDASRWYNGDEETNKVYISDKSSILVGMSRIRQLRIRKELCPKVIVESYNAPEFCFPHYSQSCEDKTAMYLPKWKVLPSSNFSPSSFKELCPKPWRYRSSEEMNNLPKRSAHASYEGGGYVADLGYDLKMTRAVVKDLSQNCWIDERTRAVIVEFTIFNSNMNILIVCNYFFEFLPTGGVSSFIKVDILDFYGTETGFAQTVLFFRLLLIIMVAAYLVIEIVKLYRHTASYFKNIWNWLSIVLITTSVTAVLIHIIREQSTKTSTKELNKNVYATVSFDEAVRLLEIETIFLSVVIFLATLRLLSLLRFSRQIVILSITVRFAGKCVASFSFILIIIFLAFAISGMLAFGAVTEAYSSFLQVCVSQFEFLLGKAVPQFDMSQVDPCLAFLFCSLYICCMTVIFMNVFIAILDCTMASVNDNLDVVSNELDLADFIVAYFTHGFLNIFRRKQHTEKCKLYCENMTLKDECAYVENCLGEIDRKISMLAEDTLSENYALLIKAWLEMSSSKRKSKESNIQKVLHQTDIYSKNDKDASLDERCTDAFSDENASLEEGSSKDRALEDISLSPAMPENTIAEGNGNPPTTSSKVDVTREKVIRMVQAIESSPDGNALIW